MPEEPDDDEDELSHLVMPRDPSLPATQLLEAPAERPDERPLTQVGKPPDGADSGLEFADTTIPNDELRTLDDPMPPDALEDADEAVAAAWDEDLETAVDDPAKP